MSPVMAKVSQSQTQTPRQTPLTGIPYEQMGFLRAWWWRHHPRPISSDGAVNPHALICGTSGMGKSRYAELEAISDIFDGKSVIFLDTHRDSFINMLHACMGLGVQPEDCIIIDPTIDTY